ncbi:TPA: hypothetical protein PXR55_003146 [Yersinia enterocolitica]|uniref:hypothetical protein n=1 Tax=Yersinia enterocolitica TaxID=630 RepID=UPI00065A8E70|nr:hypothetical protein [Yersinia enterocolitica]CRY25538.1 Uncharacterised protein [Yersinia enterocolitica]HDL6511514.1 hypothetical protein [Yersinia enterocolitica]HDL8467763.1 hypothetical protein [Yersinia enterocolitica]HDL8507757.1 hypothetical protein [Yersinia enterocolitica]HDL8512451.1 hypothetical protein [Yersinia enterocolitica]
MRIYKSPTITNKKMENKIPTIVENKNQLTSQCVGVRNVNVNFMIHNTENHTNSVKRTEFLQTALVKKPIMAAPTKAYIYCPFFTKDMIVQAIEINVPRVLQGKTPYPILSMDTGQLRSVGVKEYVNKMKKYLVYRESYFNENTSFLNKKSIEKMHKNDPVGTKRLGEYLALKQIKLISLDKANPTILEKIYIVGHGRAGENSISSGEGKRKNSSNVVSEIKKLIKSAQGHERTVEIRMMQCESADRETISSMDKRTLDESAKIKNGRQPLAQHMSNALKDIGIDTKVYGYHGNGVNSWIQNIHRSRVLEHEFMEGRNTTYRASEHRQVFSPQIKRNVLTKINIYQATPMPDPQSIRYRRQ